MDGLGDDFEGKHFGAELKGEREGGFYAVREQGPRRKHEYQVNSYLLLAEIAGLDIDVFSLFYEAKTTQDYVEFLIYRNTEDQRDLRTRLQVLNDAWDRHEMPERLPTYPTEYECKSCPFRPDCARIPVGGWIDDLQGNQPKIVLVGAK